MAGEGIFAGGLFSPGGIATGVVSIAQYYGQKWADPWRPPKWVFPFISSSAADIAARRRAGGPSPVDNLPPIQPGPGAVWIGGAAPARPLPRRRRAPRRRVKPKPKPKRRPRPIRPPAPPVKIPRKIVPAVVRALPRLLGGIGGLFYPTPTASDDTRLPTPPGGSPPDFPGWYGRPVPVPPLFTIPANEPRAFPLPPPRPGPKIGPSSPGEPAVRPEPRPTPRPGARPAPQPSARPAPQPSPGPFNYPAPTPAPMPRPFKLPLVLPLPLPGTGPGGSPLQFARPLTPPKPGAVTSPQPWASPQNDPCRSRSDRRKKRKRKPRTVCYSGTFRETNRSTIKRRRKRVPCKGASK